MMCEHRRIRSDDTGSEQRLQCVDCKKWGRFEFTMPTEQEFDLSLMRFVTFQEESNT